MFERISVLGAGTMGRSIALLFASHGLSVKLYDPSATALGQASQYIRDQVQLMLTEGWMNPTWLKTIDEHLEYTDLTGEAVREADLVIESAPENLDLKRKLYRLVEVDLPAHAIIASNTSTYPVNVLAEGLSMAKRMLIMHFFNPAHLIPLVEIVASPEVPQTTVQQIVDLLRFCKKSPVVLAKDNLGFIANRLQAAILREALHLLDQGVASAEDIDKAITEGPGLRWALSGPLEVTDYGGLDVWSKVMEQLLPDLCYDTEPPEKLKKSVMAGQLGVKSGQGIYTYSADHRIMSPEERNRRLIQLLKTKMIENR